MNVSMNAMPTFVLLWTDAVLLAALLALGLYVLWVRRTPERRAAWAKVGQDATALGSALVLAGFVLLAALDSVHLTMDGRTTSLLDSVLARPLAMREVSYSAPLACYGFQKETLPAGQRGFPRLKFGCKHLEQPEQDWLPDVLGRAALGLGGGLVLAWGVLAGLFRSSMPASRALRVARWTFMTLAGLTGLVAALSGHYHVLGTDRTGNDVLYQALKSVRTAFVIGTLSTVATLPFAVVLGLLAGYFRGWVDALIQYLYTLLSSVPNVLLIAAFVLMVQVQLDAHPERFATALERADVKIFLLCVILGVTGWAGLCRLLRAETLRLREMDYVQAAHAFGVGHGRILARHVLPNVMHLVLITTVLDFSGLVLYEAVLSYVGVGVDPSLNSFGGMINLARSEMSRDPLVWWSFASAFGVMVSLVLAANLFADGVRDAFDPRDSRRSTAH
jgi:peptide/nickel transport system permease protein